MHYIYILKNDKNGKLYKGCTNDLRKRVAIHNHSKVISTKNRGLWVLIYYEAFFNKTDALREEKFLKSGKGRERLKLLLKKTI